MKNNNYFFAVMFSVLTMNATAVSPVHNRVVEFVPAPGQFVNTIPEWESGDDAAAMAEKACQYTAEDGSMISLGAWGGYVTLGFAATIVNVAGERDIYIEGNAFQGEVSATQGGSSEPGVVYVAYDMNQNGTPDDNEWFEIAGSEYRTSIHGYEVTYQRPASDKDDIVWSDNQGNTGLVMKMPYHQNSYWPQWLDDKAELVFRGVRLPDNGFNEGTTENPYYVLKRFDFGYADNYSNFSDSEGLVRNQGAMIDIDWAVDKDGNSVKMPGVDFVRIHTGVNQTNGWLGENSTEICRVMNTHTKKAGTDEVVDESVVVDSEVLADFLSKYGGSSVGQLDNDNVRIFLDLSGVIRFSLNEPALVCIYDQSGRQCYATVMPEGRCAVDIADYPSGLYIVRVDRQTMKILKK